MNASGTYRAGSPGELWNVVRSVGLMAGAGALAMLGAAACGGGGAGTGAVPTAPPQSAQTEQGDTTAPPGGPRTGGTLRVAMGADTHTMDPALSLSTQDNTLTMATYNNLILQQHDLSLKAVLAESWEANSELTEYTFKIRRGIRFHHGKELTAEDVAFTFKRLLDPDVASPGRSSVNFIKDVAALDSHEVRFDLEAPNSFLPDALSIYQARIIPSDIDTNLLSTQVFGTGPFKVEEHRPGERTVFAKNETYWEDGLPYLDGLIFLYMPDPESRIEALRTGAVDVLFPLEAAGARSLERDSRIKISEVASAGYLNFAMDVTRGPFADLRVRKAIQMATDRAAIQQAALFGRGTIANDHPIPPNDPNYAHDLAIPPYAPEEARRLLADAGYPDGLQVTLHTSTVTPGMVEMAVTFQETAAAAGIDVSIRRHAEDIYWADIWMQEPFSTVTWNGRPPDEALSIVYMSDAPWNESYYQNPTLDELVVRARAEQDPDARAEIYGEIQRILVDEVPRIIPVFRPIMAATLLDVRGVEAHPNNWLILTEAWLDR